MRALKKENNLKKYIYVYTYLKHFNPTADVRLFGQEFMGPSYAVGLAEMLIKGQNAENFRHTDTLKNDCFPDTKMRFLLENPPFGTPWSGDSAKAGQEDAVKADEIFSILMGEEVEPRREFIEANAKYVKNLDI